MIIERIVVTAFSANCYLVGCSMTKKAIVIDPGGDVYRIMPLINKHKLTVKAIVSTHAHIDHAGGVEELKGILKVPYLLHRAEVALLGQLPEIGAYFDIDVGGIPQVDDYLSHDDILEAGTLRFKVIETPGHSPCGICLRSRKMVFVGDTIFKGSIGRTDLFGGDYDILINSIKTRLMTLPDDVVIYSGHGEPTTIKHEKQHNPFCR